MADTFSIKKTISQPESNGGEIEYKANYSGNYKFSWDAKTSEAKLVTSEKQNINFQLAEKPLDVTIFKPRNIIAIITTPSGDINGSQNLYIYDSGQIYLVYRGETTDVNPSFTINERLYSYDPSAPQGYNDSYNGGVNFSPDGKYLTFDVLGYENFYSYIYSINEKKMLDEGNLNLFSLFWSPDSQCLLNFAESAMYGYSLDIAKLTNGKFVFRTLSIPEDLSNKLVNLSTEDYLKLKREVLWGPDCSGQIKSLLNDSAVYSFSNNSNIVTVANGNFDQNEFEQGVDSKTYQENIYLIVAQ